LKILIKSWFRQKTINNYNNMTQIFKNREKKFSILHFQFSILLLLAAIMLLTGCPGESPVVDPTDDPDNPPAAVMKDATVSGTVLDISGSPLSGVNVTTGTASATTGGDGTFTFSKAGTVDDRAVFRLEKSGYFSLTRSAMVDSTGEITVQAMMYRKGTTSGVSLQTDFNSAQAKTLEVGKLKIELPAACFANADGSAYSGQVRADILYLGNGNENASLLMPGGDLATTKKDKMVLPIGVADVNFTDAAGKPLKIAAKTDIPVTYALPDGVNAAELRSTVPLWTFDEARGVWREEGAATLRGNAYTGTATHFSPHGFGYEYNASFIFVAATGCDDKPAYPAAITFEKTSLGVLVDDDHRLVDNSFFPKGVYYTDYDGYRSVMVPMFSTVKVTGTFKGQTRTATVNTRDGQTAEVNFKFDDGCGKGGDLVFSLKAINKNTVSIVVQPAMPEPDPSWPYGRYAPNRFFEAGLLFPFDTEWLLGMEGLAINVNEGGWNNDYTEYTYVFSSAGRCWSGTVKMSNLKLDWLDKDMKKYLNINSVSLSANNPALITIGNPREKGGKFPCW
jgi:hypothetical protein